MGYQVQEIETIFRVGIFVIVFIVVAAAEVKVPKRKLMLSKSNRWVINLVIVALNPVIVRLIFPILPLGMSVYASENGWGMFNLIAIPYWLKVVVCVMLLDLAVYTQHVLHHALPILWRLHMVHHADMEIDLTTGLRFHPIEILVSMAIKLSVVFALGAPAFAVLIFEVALNATSMFNHGNIRIPVKVDKIIRLLVVTPDMHRVHHSVIVRETNSNFGFSLPWWDRLFGTYRAQPAKGHTDMTIGLAPYRNPKELSLYRLLIMPFIRGPQVTTNKCQ